MEVYCQLIVTAIMDSGVRLPATTTLNEGISHGIAQRESFGPAPP